MTGDDITVLLFAVVFITALAWTAGLIAVAFVALKLWGEEHHKGGPLARRSPAVDLDLGFDRLALAPWPDELAQRRAERERDGGRVA